MSEQFLTKLRTDRERAQTTIDDLLTRAATDERDLEDAETAIVEANATKIRELDPQIQIYSDLELRKASAATLAQKVDRATSDDNRETETLTREAANRLLREEFPTPGLWIQAQHFAKTDRDVAKRLQRVMAHQTTSDNPGIIPTPVVGPLLGILERRRPTINSVNNKVMPAKGKSFDRPRVTQHTLVGEQTGEKQPLLSQKMTIDSISVPKKTVGGVLNISQQDIDWSEPSILDLVIEDMLTQIAIETNAGYVVDFNTAVTAAIPSTPATFVADFYLASSMVIAATGQPPSTLWVSPDVWAQLGGLLDSTGRPLFSAGAPANSVGSTSPGSVAGSVLGVPLVVDAAWPNQTCVLGDATYAEFYTSPDGMLRAVEPELLGLQIAVYQYVAGLIADPGAFVKLTGLGTP
jgi:HK97 family phage major capsid protein